MSPSLSAPSAQPPSFASPDNYRWLIVGMLWFICFLNYADRVAISSVFPLLEKQYHFTKTQLGAIGAAFTWVYAGFAPTAGTIGDRYSKKTVILAGLYIWSTVTGFTGLCTRFWQFVVVRGAEGLGETFYFPASMALVSQYHGTSTRSRAIGIHQTSIYAGTIFGSWAAGYLAQKHGWQSPFLIFAIAGIVLGLILTRFIRDPREQGSSAKYETAKQEQQRSTKQDLGTFLQELVRTPTAVLILAAYFGANMVGFVFLTWMPTFLKEKFHVNLAMAGLGATVFIQVASIIGAIVGGIVADYRVKSKLQGRIQVQMIAVLIGAPFIFECGKTRNGLVLAIAMTLFGFCKGVYDASLTSAYYDVIQPGRRSTATGIMNLVGWVGAGIGAVAIGVAVDKGATMSSAISSTALIYVGVGLMLWFAGSIFAKKDIEAATLSADT